LTITGRFKGTPISIVSIGMGSPNMDFFVREIRECIRGDIAIVRLGSCGALIDVPVGTVVVPKASVTIRRNVDFDFVNPENCEESAYHISKPVYADVTLAAEVCKALHVAKPPSSESAVLAGTVNASADSFYSSQGRQTSFPDHNADLIERLQASTENITTLEMETFHLYHLAACWGGRSVMSKVLPTPLTTGPVNPIILQTSFVHPMHPAPEVSPNFVIWAAAAQIVFASRTSQDFISPKQVEELEHWTGQGVLNALLAISIPEERMHPTEGSVWELV